MPQTSTLDELDRATLPPVHVLALVLSYDDLLRDDAALFSLDADLVLGRSEGRLSHSAGQLLLPDGFLSRRHASIARVGDTRVVRDEGSRNGTWVNGQRVTQHVLCDGDLIEIGHSLLCYRVSREDPWAAAHAPLVGPTRTLSPRVAALARDIARIARSPEPVLLLGETGTGKELAARAVHALSGRAGAFCAVDCGAIPETLFEATFFGHRRGAFTGATEARGGEIARADGGTLFLDEVGNLPAVSQAKLLRAVETGQVAPLGSAETRDVDVRWVAATNADLFADEGGFRGDLLRRLAGYVGHLVPLRERREDLGILTAHVLRDAGFATAAITVAAGRALFTGAFPGNVRQLRATLRSAATLSAGRPIDVEHLPATAGAQPGVQPASLSRPPPSALAAPRLPSGLPPAPLPDPREAEPKPRRTEAPPAHEVEAALAASSGNVVRAAQLLGTHPRQVYRWIERHGIGLDRWRS